MPTDLPSNKDVVTTFHHRLWGEGDLGAIDEAVHPEAVTHWGDATAATADAIRDDAARYFAGFTDVRTWIDDLLGDGDKVVLRWHTTGRHTGPYGKVAATGREVTMEGIDVFRLAEGRIVEAWSMWDGLSVYHQLGLVDPDVGP